MDRSVGTHTPPGHLRTIRGRTVTLRVEMAHPQTSAGPSLCQILYQRAFQSATDNRRSEVVTSGRGTRSVSDPIHVG